MEIEAMMIDQDTNRIWADHHGSFGRWAGDVARQMSEAFRVLARVQYDQPWRASQTPDDNARH